MAFITTTVFLCLTIFGTVFVDVKLHEEDFAKSITGQTLKGYGGYEYGLLAYESCLDAKNWLKEKTPEYVDAFMEWSSPYRRLSRDFGLVAFNVTKNTLQKITAYANEQYPVAQYWVQKNLPGIRDASYNAAMAAVNAARNNTLLMAKYLENNVFVGSWSPESMKKITLEAYDSTQEYASSTISWIYKSIYNTQPQSSSTK